MLSHQGTTDPEPSRRRGWRGRSWARHQARLVRFTLAGAFLALTTAAPVAFAAPGSPPGTAESMPVIVSSDWLADRLGQPDLVLLHVAPVIRHFQNGHIPGARFLWPGWLAISTPEESVIPPPLKALQKTLRELGITKGSRIVLYGMDGNIISVCRMFVTLEYAGLAGKVAILDGGFNAWQAEGRPSTRETPRFARGTITVQPDLQVMASTQWLSRNLGNPSVTIVDARSQPFFEGKSGLPRPGHLPRAVSLPSASCYVQGSSQFVAPAQMADLFKGLAFPVGNTLVTYCFVGNAACVVYVAARQLGLPVRLYDGSMEEWSSWPELPVELQMP